MGVYKNLIEPFLLGLPPRLFGGVNFDKTTDYGRVEHAADVSLSQITMSFQVKFTITSNSIICRKSTNDTNWFASTGFLAPTADTRGCVVFSGAATETSHTARTTFVGDGNWHRVGYTGNSATREQRAYTDGAFSNNSVMLSTFALNTQAWFFGGSGSTSGNSPVQLAEHALYNMVKSDAYMKDEALTLKRYAMGLAPKPDGLVWYFPNEPVAVTGQAWTHEWTDIVSGRVMKLYNNPTPITYER